MHRITPLGRDVLAVLRAYADTDAGANDACPVASAVRGETGR